MTQLPDFFKGVRIGRFLLVFVSYGLLVGIVSAALQDVVGVTRDSGWRFVFAGVPLLGGMLLIFVLDTQLRKGRLRWLARNR